MWPQVHAGPQAEVSLSAVSIGSHVSGVTRGLVSIVHSQLQFKNSVFPKGGPRSLKHSSASRCALALGQPESGARRPWGIVGGLRVRAAQEARLSHPDLRASLSWPAATSSFPPHRLLQQPRCLLPAPFDGASKRGQSRGFGVGQTWVGF